MRPSSRSSTYSRLVRLALALVFVASTAFANGRPPQTNGVFFRPGDAQSIYIRTTFGLLISHDDGCSFRWVCEQAVDYGGEFDPKYAIAADGTIFATTFRGLRVSRDGGCTWSTAPVGSGELWVDAIDIAPNGDIWVATAESAAPNNIYRSTDNGMTFTPRGMSSPTVWWKSVKVAPSDSDIIYIAGNQVMPTPTARLFKMEKGGTQWIEHPLFGEQRDPPTMKFGSMPTVIISAIDPKDPNTVFLTSIEANPPKGDRLYRSTDGGVTFTQVFMSNDKIRDVFFAADGNVYLATVGSGTHRSTNRGATFVPVESTPQLACLGQRGADNALVGCGANWEPDFKAVARSADSAQWQKVFRFVDLAGPLACPAGSQVADMCESRWPALKEMFGSTGPGVCPAVPDGPPKKPPSHSGSCNAGGSSSSFPLVLLVLAWLYRPSRQLA